MPPQTARASGPEHPRWGLRTRVLALLLPCLFVLLAIDTWYDYQAGYQLLQDAHDQALLESASALDERIAPGGDGTIGVQESLDLQTLLEGSGPPRIVLYAALTPLSESQASGHAAAPPGPARMLVGAPDLPTPPPGAVHERGSLRYDAHYRGQPLRVVALARTLRDGSGRPYHLLVQAAQDDQPRREAWIHALGAALLRDSATVAIVLLLVWFGVNHSLRPLERLHRSVLARAPDDLRPLDAHELPHEVAPLVVAINRHIDARQQLLAEQTRLLADASHQLRTPLAIMLTQAGYALREPDPALMRETLHAIVAQLERSRRLCEQLLALAHANQPAERSVPTATADLNQVAREVTLQYLPLAREKQQDLGWVDACDGDAHGDGTATGPDGDAAAVPVAADAAELHEALANLVHNAIRYTPVGGHITVSVRVDPAGACAEVRDDGPGIAVDRRAGMFERFAKGSAAPDQNGAGLGLPIARAYARRNGGEIELVDGDPNAAGGQGLAARLRLPV
ncbi:MAG: sensor histidine kinase, partial [Proteobacteria bacterium]|nr:sensor histidine kinase [Pseudomonadota bacterium]